MRVPRTLFGVLIVLGISTSFIIYMNCEELVNLLISNSYYYEYENSTILEREALSRRWQTVGDFRNLSVFSAYYNEDDHNVQVIGLVARTNVKSVFTCTFKTHRKWISVTGSLEFVDTPPNSIKFHTVYIRCPIPNSYKPTAIRVHMENYTATLRVIYNQKRQYNFTVCLPNLYGPYTNHYRLIETIETDRLFGAEHFIVYNGSVTSRVNDVLKYYVAKGILEVIPWKEPVHVFYHGQWAFLQDCLLASRYGSKYVVVKDLDEIIVPHRHRNWMELLNEIEKDNPNIGSHTFRNSFFHLEWSMDTNALGVFSKDIQINSLTHVWRDNRFMGKTDRCKSIVRPERVVIAGIHYTMKFVEGYVEKYVDTDIAYLHHYRFGRPDTNNKVKDDFMRKYSEELITTINRTLVEIA